SVHVEVRTSGSSSVPRLMMQSPSRTVHGSKASIWLLTGQFAGSSAAEDDSLGGFVVDGPGLALGGRLETMYHAANPPPPPSTSTSRNTRTSRPTRLERCGTYVYCWPWSTVCCWDQASRGPPYDSYCWGIGSVGREATPCSYPPAHGSCGGA